MPARRKPVRKEPPRSTERREGRRALALLGAAGALALALLLLWLWGREARRAEELAAYAPPDAAPDAALLDELPETPERDEVSAPLRKLLPLIAACNTEGLSGVLRVNLTIKGATGAVSEATVAKQFEGTELARCATRLVERAQFPRFRKKQLTVVYPYTLAGWGDAGLDDGAPPDEQPEAGAAQPSPRAEAGPAR